MNTHVRGAVPHDAASISAIVQAGFVKCVAPDWEPCAQHDFLRDTSADQLAGRIAEATIVEVYEEEGQVLGVISMPRANLVQLFFVAPGHLNRGIGRTLWESARRQIEERYPEVKTVELNASPYSVPAYQALGFFPISKPFRRRGAVATRMACWLPGKGLDVAKHAT